jgi:hypothetical protein
VTWTIWALQGTGVELKLPLLSRTGTYEIVTSGKENPRSEVSRLPDTDINITYLLQQVAAEEPESTTGKPVEHKGFICDGYENGIKTM